MIISVCILAKNEARNIGRTLQALAAQTLLTGGAHQIEVIVAANGCTDDTAAQAQAQRGLFEALPNVQLQAHNLPFGGKSRTWNHAVHQLSRKDTELFIFLDADVEMVSDQVLESLMAELLANPALQAVSGNPAKDISQKQGKSLLDRFSLAVTSNSRGGASINGSLYVGRAGCFREIWLPDETPGEDGFLNAMVHTRGFSIREDDSRIAQAAQPTHYFQAHSPKQFIVHERRMVVGTIVNRWLFEHLWSLNLTEPAGPLIAEWNRNNPEWVQQIISRNVGNRRWVIPHAITFGRIKSPAKVGWLKFLLRLPTSLAATALTLPPAVLGNAALKRQGSAGLW